MKEDKITHSLDRIINENDTEFFNEICDGLLDFFKEFVEENKK